jgi:site-specific recombinase XerD
MKEKNINKLFEEYARECEYTRGLRPETIRGYRVTFESFKKIMPEVTLEDLQRETMAHFFECLKTRKRSRRKAIDR